MPGTKQPGNLIGMAHPVQRNVVCEFFLQLRQSVTLLPLFQQRSVDMARAKRVYTDVPISVAARSPKCARRNVPRPWWHYIR